MDKEILLVTTNCLQGYEIRKYYGYISESVVIGTGFVTEFFSSVSDTFGTNSEKLERKIATIRKQAVDKLKEKARSVGSNIILGVHMEVNEISSNQRMMFMVTCAGTAVYGIKQKESIEQRADQQVDGSDVYRLIETKKKAVQLERILKNTDTHTDTLLKSDIFVEDMLEQLSTGDISDELRQYSNDVDMLILRYALTNDFRLSEKLHHYLFHLPNDDSFSSVLEELYTFYVNQPKRLLRMKENKLFIDFLHLLGEYAKYPVILEYIKKDNIYFEILVLYPILEGKKASFDKEDMANIKQVIDLLKKAYWCEETEGCSDYAYICKCGKKLQKDEICGCMEKEQKINKNSLHLKRQVISQLEWIYGELQSIFHYA